MKKICLQKFLNFQKWEGIDFTKHNVDYENVIWVVYEKWW